MENKDSKLRMCGNNVFHFFIMYLHIFSYNDPVVYHKICMYSFVYFIVDMYGLDNLYKCHHIGALTFLSLPIFSNNVQPNKLYDSWIMMERSTAILNFYRITKLNILKPIFAFMFFYYRIYRFLQINLSSDIERDKYNICNNHFLYTPDFCNSLINVESIIFFSLNSYWGIKIIQKAIRENIKKKD